MIEEDKLEYLNYWEYKDFLEDLLVCFKRTAADRYLSFGFKYNSDLSETVLGISLNIYLTSLNVGGRTVIFNIAIDSNAIKNFSDNIFKYQ